MIRGIHHVQTTIPIGAEDEARRFYCGILGLREVEKPDALKARGGFWLEAGELQVHVGTEDGVDRNRTKAHIAFEVTSLVEWRDRLQTAGVQLLDGIPIPGCRRFEFRDPFGNRIELIEPT